MESLDDMRNRYDQVVKKGEVPALRCQTSLYRNTVPIRREGQKNVTLSADGLKSTCMALKLRPLTEISKLASNPKMTKEDMEKIRSKMQELNKELSMPLKGCSCQLVGITVEQSNNSDYVGVHPHSLR